MSIEIDEITIICNGCGRTHTMMPDKTIVGAEDLKLFIDTKLPAYRCPCGATHCDLKCRLKGERA